MKIVNVTPHVLNFRAEDGTEIAVPPSGTVINAQPVEVSAGVHPSGATLVRTQWVPAQGAEEILARLEAENPQAVIVGSMIAAQAFPGRLLVVVPAPGFERVPPAEKRMRPDKFTTF